MKKIKKVVDERQELELLKIEHVGFWAMFWGSCISIIVQVSFMNASFREFGPEFIIFTIGSFIIMAGYLRKGQWDYYTEPCMKTYLMGSIIGTAIFSIIFAIARYMKYARFRSDIKFFVVTTLIFTAFIFILLFITLLIAGKFVLRQRRKLEQEFNDDEKNIEK